MTSNRSQVSPYIDSLWRLVSEVPFEVGCWSEAGDEFIVKQRYEFENFALKFFTCNWKTFVRQLHFYGFSKTDSRGITWSFSHPSFQQGRPDLLCRVKRKTFGKGKLGGTMVQLRNGDEIERLKAAFASYKANAEVELREAKEDMLEELMAVKRELSILKKSMQPKSRQQQEDQPVKRRRRWEASATITEITEDEDEESKGEDDFLDSLSFSGIEGLLQQFGEDMMVPKRLDPNIHTNLPDIWIVMNRRVNVGARFFTSFLNSFVAAARSWYGLHSEPVPSHALAQDYPLRKLQRMLNPAASKILGSSLSTDELAHDLIIRMGSSDEDEDDPQGLTVFEYSLDGHQVHKLNADDFATCLTNIALAVQKLVNNQVKENDGSFERCELMVRLRPLLTPFTQKALALAHKSRLKTLYDKATAFRLYNCGCN